MKFLDLNGLKHLLGKIVKYDKGTSDVSGIDNLTVNKIRPTYIQPKAALGTAQVSIVFPYKDTIDFKAGKMQIRYSTNELSGFHLESYPILEKVFPEEFKTLNTNDLFYVIADLLYTLKEKGIIE